MEVEHTRHIGDRHKKTVIRDRFARLDLIGISELTLGIGVSD